MTDIMGIGRGYRLQLWPVLQDLNQLEELYPKRWQTFLSNAGAQLFFAPRDLKTAEYVRNPKTEEYEAPGGLRSIVSCRLPRQALRAPLRRHVQLRLPEPSDLWDPSDFPAALAQPIAETLLKLGPRGEIEPQLAVAWQADADRKRWRISLRAKVTFHDGEPLTGTVRRRCWRL